MKQFVMLLLAGSLLSGCSGTFLIPEIKPLCDGLENPLVDLTESIVEHQATTHVDILNQASVLVQAYRAGCD